MQPESLISIIGRLTYELAVPVSRIIDSSTVSLSVSIVWFALILGRTFTWRIYVRLLGTGNRFRCESGATRPEERSSRGLYSKLHRTKHRECNQHSTLLSVHRTCCTLSVNIYARIYVYINIASVLHRVSRTLRRGGTTPRSEPVSKKGITCSSEESSLDGSFECWTPCMYLKKRERERESSIALYVSTKS